MGALSAEADDSALAVALDNGALTWQTGGQAPWISQTAVAQDGVDAAESGLISDDGQSWIETTVSGPTSLSFWWKASSERGFDQFQFLIDGIERINISGEVHWEQRSFDLGDGLHVLRWQYVKDATESAGLDRAWLDWVQYSPPSDVAPVILTQPASQSAVDGGVATFRVSASGAPAPAYQWYFNGSSLSGATTATYTITSVTLQHAGTYWVVASNRAGTVASQAVQLAVTLVGDVVEAAELSWTVGGESPWLGQSTVTHDGIDGLESGAITNSQQSWVHTTVSGPGVLSFWWKVSSEPFYDGLQFLTNGVVGASLSGEADWDQKVFALGRGMHELRWRYFKDGSITVGQDRGWLDQVTYTANKPPVGLNLVPSALAVAENELLLVHGFFTDPDAADAHSVVIQWGDGSAPTTLQLPAGTLAFDTAHQYGDDLPGTADTNIIRVTVSDEAGSVTSETRVRITNAPPAFANVALPRSIFPYETITVTGQVNDPSAADTLRLSLDWGDGSEAATTNYAAGGGVFAVSHRFVLGKTNLTVTLTLIDDDEGVTVLRTNLNIRPFPSAPRLVSIRRLGPDSTRLRVEGTIEARYVVEASPDLRRWTALAVGTVTTNDWFEVDDMERSRYTQRFYRARWETQSPVPRFSDIWRLGDGGLRGKLVGAPQATYRLDAAVNLGSWTPFRTVTTDGMGVAVFEDSPAGSRRFYRAVEP